MRIGEVEISWLGHSGFLLENSKIIYIDPYNISSENLPKADVVLITHGHYDHCSFADLKKVVKEGTRIFATPDSQSKLLKFDFPIKLEIVSPGEDYDLGSVKISTVPAYNVDKPFHSKSEDLVGYVVKMNGVIVYHAGDTDKVPEMQKLTGFNQYFVALLPVGGRYTMTAEEAFEAAKLIKPTLSIPMHWGSIIGTHEDALDFKELCSQEGLRVEILEKK